MAVGTSPAVEKKGPASAASEGDLRAAGDNAGATDTLAPKDAPRTFIRQASGPRVGAERVEFLPLSRQNGTGDGGELDFDAEGFDGEVELNVLNVFGGPDGNVKLDAQILSREDTDSQELKEVASWKNVDKAGSAGSKSVKTGRFATFAYAVTGTAGGHCIEFEVIGKRKSA